MARKPENYDWNERLRRQCKESLIAVDYDVLSVEDIESDDILISLVAETCFIETSVLNYKPIILKFRHEDICKKYYILFTDNIEDMAIDMYHDINHDIYLATYCLPENGFAKAFDRLMVDLIPYELIIELYLTMYENIPFRYPEYPDNSLFNYLKGFIDFEATNDGCKYSLNCNYDDILLKQFHHSIYDTPIGDNYSMSTAWKCKDLLRNVICNRMMYKKNLSQSIVQNGFNISKIAPRPSVFSIKHALVLLKSDILKDYNNIIDPIVGFSGKMVASIITNKKYTGIYDYGLDNNFDIRIKETQLLLNWIYDHFDIFHDRMKNIELYKLDECLSMNNTYDAMLCEIPYWNDKINVSTYTDDIIDYLTSTFKCSRYVFITKGTDKYKSNILEIITKSSHLYTTKYKIIVIDK